MQWIKKKLKIKTLGITHGTISKNFNKIDKIYKKIISEAVFSKNYDFFPLQTKITSEAAETHSLPKLNLKTETLYLLKIFLNLGKKIKFYMQLPIKILTKCIFMALNYFLNFTKT